MKSSNICWNCVIAYPAMLQRVMVSEHVSTLHELASQENVDLVLAGAHGYSRQSRWPFGSVVSSFITYGTTPLLIVQDVQDAPLHSNGAASYRRQWLQRRTAACDD